VDFDEVIPDAMKFCAGAYSFLKDYMNAVIQFSRLQEDISYDINTDCKILPEDASKGDCVARVNLSFTVDDRRSAEKDIVVFYYVTNTNKIIISSADDDFRVVSKYGSDVAKRLLELNSKSEDETEHRTLLWTKQGKKKFEPISAEERLLKYIFGEQEAAYTTDINGLGFYLYKYTPEYVFKKFLEKHKDTFCRSDGEKKIYESYVNGDTPRSKAFEYYLAETTTGAGGRSWLAAIVNIIHREQGINVQGWESRKSDCYENEDCVMFANSMPWEYNDIEKSLSKQALTVILDEYARELRTDVMPCHFIATVYK
jgi:hypothetical protein